MLNPGRDVKLAEERVKGYKSFTNKIWNAANFLNLNDVKFIDQIDTETINLDSSKWILKEFEEVQKKYFENIEKYQFHEIASLVYHFTWHTFCDWYIEFIKSDFKDPKKSEETKKISGWVFVQTLKLLHPIMPFITEKLWLKSPNKLPDDWRSINEPIERVICDYISGMTDRYASRLHKDLYE